MTPIRGTQEWSEPDGLNARLLSYRLLPRLSWEKSTRAVAASAGFADATDGEGRAHRCRRPEVNLHRPSVRHVPDSRAARPGFPGWQQADSRSQLAALTRVVEEDNEQYWSGPRDLVAR